MKLCQIDAFIFVFSILFLKRRINVSFQVFRVVKLEHKCNMFLRCVGTHLQDHVKPQPRKLQRKMVVYKLVILHLKRVPFWSITGLKRDLNQCHISSIIRRSFMCGQVRCISGLAVLDGICGFHHSFCIDYKLCQLIPQYATRCHAGAIPEFFIWCGGGGTDHEVNNLCLFLKVIL